MGRMRRCCVSALPRPPQPLRSSFVPLCDTKSERSLDPATPTAPFVICTALRHKERTESRSGDPHRSVRHLYRSATQRANGARVRCVWATSRETTPVAPARLGPAAPSLFALLLAGVEGKQGGAVSLINQRGVRFGSGDLHRSTRCSLGSRGHLRAPRQRASGLGDFEPTVRRSPPGRGPSRRASRLARPSPCTASRWRRPASCRRSCARRDRPESPPAPSWRI